MTTSKSKNDQETISRLTAELDRVKKDLAAAVQLHGETIDYYEQQITKQHARILRLMDMRSIAQRVVHQMDAIAILAKTYEVSGTLWVGAEGFLQLRGVVIEMRDALTDFDTEVAFPGPEEGK